MPITQNIDSALEKTIGPQGVSDAALSGALARAEGALDRVSRRDPAKVYHKMTRDQLIALAPGFAWNDYLQAVQAPSLSSLNVAVPEFFTGLGALLNSASLAD